MQDQLTLVSHKMLKSRSGVAEEHSCTYDLTTLYLSSVKRSWEHGKHLHPQLHKDIFTRVVPSLDHSIHCAHL